MLTWLYLTIGLLFLAVAGTLVWRYGTGKSPLPCPAWLGWMVELDNPILRSNSVREILPLLELQPGMQVLDFGCGPGRLTIPIARQIAPGGAVTAFDLQAGMLERVRLKAARENLQNIHTLQGAAGEDKLGTRRFDRALLVTVLGEVPDKTALLQEIHLSLKEDGRLVITETIADPHFQTRQKVLACAAAAGFKQLELHGSRISYSLLLAKA